MKLVFLLLIIFFNFNNIICSAQKTKKLKYPNILVGTTVTKLYNNNAYKIINIGLQLPYLLKHYTYNNELYLLFEPSYSSIKLYNNNSYIKYEHEYIFTTCLKQIYYIKNFNIYMTPFFGILYKTKTDYKQSKGLNFSTGFGFGIGYHFKHIKISNSIRIRHISNAGIKQPNGGFNNLIMYIGIGIL